jgi:hypothetical protein
MAVSGLLTFLFAVIVVLNGIQIRAQNRNNIKQTLNYYLSRAACLYAAGNCVK